MSSFHFNFRLCSEALSFWSSGLADAFPGCAPESEPVREEVELEELRLQPEKRHRDPGVDQVAFFGGR